MDIELLDYKRNKKSLAFILKYHNLIATYAKLAKGNCTDYGPAFRWFYGLFLEGAPRTVCNLLEYRDRTREATAHLSDKDCYNQVVLFFLELASKYKPLRDGNYRKPIPERQAGQKEFYRYIRMVLGLRVKNWVVSIMKNSQVVEVEQEEEFLEDESIEPFSINLSWVVNDTENPLFRDLRPYDKYILYLYFFANNTIEEIAHITYQAKDTVNCDLNRIIRQCREASLKAL